MSHLLVLRSDRPVRCDELHIFICDWDREDNRIYDTKALLQLIGRSALAVPYVCSTESAVIGPLVYDMY